MTRSNQWLVLVCCSLIAVAACKPKGDDDDDDGIPGFIRSQPSMPVDVVENVEGAVQLGYPTQPITFTLLPVILAQLSNDQDGCPIYTDNSTGTTTDALIEGDCTVPGDDMDPDSYDTSYSGTIVMAGDANATTITFNKWRIESQETCMGTGEPTAEEWNGRTIVSAPDITVPGADYDVEIQVSVSGPNDTTCNPANITLAWDYEVTTENSGADTDMDGEPDEFITFNGGGDVGYLGSGDFEDVDTGDIPDAASWAATATDLQHSTIDEISPGEECNEALSGTLEVSASGNSAIVTSDGDTNCTADACAPWSLNGTDQPTEICGIPGCHVSTPRRVSLGTIALALAGAALLAGRRRRKRFSELG